MIRCQECGTDNPEAEVYCFKCGSLLDTAAIDITIDTTTPMENKTSPVDPKRRWGTAHFDSDSFLILSVRDYETEPMQVNLSHDKTIGRIHEGFTPEIDLSGFDAYEQGVSRQHAILRRQNDTIVIVDLNSANNTFLNGQRLVPDQPRILRDGDEIRLGQLVLRVNFNNDLPR